TIHSGEGGIRTHGTLLASTRSPGAPIRPLSHLSRQFGRGSDGERGIRTPGATRAQLISNQSPSTTRPSLRCTTPLGTQLYIHVTESPVPVSAGGLFYFCPLPVDICRVP